MPARTLFCCATRTKNCRSLPGSNRRKLQLFKRARRDNGKLHPVPSRIRMSRLGIAKGTVRGKIVVLKAEQPQREPVKPLPFPAHQSAEFPFKFSKIRHVRFWLPAGCPRQPRKQSTPNSSPRSNQKPGSAASLWKNMVEQEINEDAGDGNIHPDRPCPTRDLFVAFELSPDRVVKGR